MIFTAKHYVNLRETVFILVTLAPKEYSYVKSLSKEEVFKVLFSCVSFCSSNSTLKLNIYIAKPGVPNLGSRGTFWGSRGYFLGVRGVVLGGPPSNMKILTAN